MTSLQLLLMLSMLAVTRSLANYLRKNDTDSLLIERKAVSPSNSGCNDDLDGSDDVTQDATTSKGLNEVANVGEVDQVDGVKAWAQCGGLYYLGETKCQQATSCKQLSDFISVCFPESRPTEQVVRLEL